MDKRRYLRTGTGLLLTLCLGGCASTPVDMETRYTPVPPHHEQGSEYLKPVKAKPTPVSCELYLEQLTDQRRDKQDMGNVANRPVRGVDMLAWLSSSLASLGPAGYRVDTQPSATANLMLDVELLKAYLESESTSVASIIVVRVTYKRPDGTVLAQQLYRGSDTSIDWVAGDGETNTDFRLATGDMLHKLQPDIGRYCAGSQPPASVANASPQK